MTVLLPSNLRGFNEFSVSRYLIERINYPVDTGRKLNVHKTFRRRPGRLSNVFCTFNLRPVSTGYSLIPIIFPNLIISNIAAK